MCHISGLGRRTDETDSVCPSSRRWQNYVACCVQPNLCHALTAMQTGSGIRSEHQLLGLPPARGKRTNHKSTINFLAIPRYGDLLEDMDAEEESNCGRALVNSDVGKWRNGLVPVPPRLLSMIQTAMTMVTTYQLPLLASTPHPHDLCLYLWRYR